MGLPNEIIFQIIFEMSVKDVINFSRTCKKINSLCNDEYIWKYMLNRDFKNIILPSYKSPKEYYQLNVKYHIVDLYIEDDYKGKLLLSRNSKLEDTIVSVVANFGINININSLGANVTIGLSYIIRADSIGLIAIRIIYKIKDEQLTGELMLNTLTDNFNIEDIICIKYSFGNSVKYNVNSRCEKIRDIIYPFSSNDCHIKSYYKKSFRDCDYEYDILNVSDTSDIRLLRIKLPYELIII